MAHEKLGLPISFNDPYKLCDFKPAFGTIFAEYLNEYDFWGNADIDLIYGNIRRFLTEELLSEYDVITSRKEYLAGHLTLYRNRPEFNRLYENSVDYPRVFLDANHLSFCECSRMWHHLHSGGSIFDPYVRFDKLSIKKKKPSVESMTHVVKRLENEGYLRAHFKTIIKDRPELLEYRNWRLRWQRGCLTDEKSGTETLYFHMIGLKDRPDFVIPEWEEIPEQFFISRKGFTAEAQARENFFDRLLEKIPLWNIFCRWRNLPY
ncbi:MAG: hypothetical protein DRH08_07575 [Deltaproteobacteria bacterium]|nr:MAG: hypothetical protein DRH08_07575 [Deltaproteobacteria bacterium]